MCMTRASGMRLSLSSKEKKLPDSSIEPGNFIRSFYHRRTNAPFQLILSLSATGTSTALCLDFLERGFLLIGQQALYL